MNIDDLLRQSEGKTLEFKATLGNTETFLKSVVAFANTAGGIVVFGVEDKTRRVLGIEEPLDLEERIANLISDAVRPRLMPEIDIYPWRKTHLIAIRVFPGSNRPYYLKAHGIELGVYVRIGSTDRKADRILIEELRRYVGARSFDEEPMAALNSEAIDFRAASEYFTPVRRLMKKDLAVLGMTVRHQGGLRATVGGVLLFGKDRRSWFPDAYIQTGRFKGGDRTKILDTGEIDAYLPIAVEEALAFIRKHERVALAIEEARHREEWSVPLVAVRETVINAVVHADYAQRGAPIRISVFDDRIEVENPGSLPFGLTVPDILQGVSKLRNRVIGRVFKELGLIEQWGSGIARIIAACREARLADPVFEEVGWHFRVTIYKGTIEHSVSDAVEQAILEMLADGQGYTTAEIARTIGRTPRATRTRLAGLVERQRIVEVGSSPKDPGRKYYLRK